MRLPPGFHSSLSSIAAGLLVIVSVLVVVVVLDATAQHPEHSPPIATDPQKVIVVEPALDPQALHS